MSSSVEDDYKDALECSEYTGFVGEAMIGTNKKIFLANISEAMIGKKYLSYGRFTLQLIELKGDLQAAFFQANRTFNDHKLYEYFTAIATNTTTCIFKLFNFVPSDLFHQCIPE